MSFGDVDIKRDQVLESIIRELKSEYRCHTIVLYGSRARGLATATSDYDVFGVRRSGQKTRIAKRQNGYYWDVFVYSEKDLRRLSDQHLSWRGARILYGHSPYGRRLLSRIRRLIERPHKPEPQYQIDILKVWAQKELDRCRVNDIQGLYRRAEFHAALIDHYFVVRKQRFWGPKAAFEWLEENDPKTFRLVQNSLKDPSNLARLRSAASRVYRVALK
jgi:predicted nucleotidyltransferase